MNIYELLGRISVLHLDCEELFSKIGSIIDKKRVDLTQDSDNNFSSDELSVLESNLLFLNNNISEYKDLVNSYKDNQRIKVDSVNIVSYILEELLESGDIIIDNITFIVDSSNTIKYIKYNISDNIIGNNLYIIINPNNSREFHANDITFTARMKTIINDLTESHMKFSTPVYSTNVVSLDSVSQTDNALKILAKKTTND